MQEVRSRAGELALFFGSVVFLLYGIAAMRSWIRGVPVTQLYWSIAAAIACLLVETGIQGARKRVVRGRPIGVSRLIMAALCVLFAHLSIQGLFSLGYFPREQFACFVSLGCAYLISWSVIKTIEHSPPRGPCCNRCGYSLRGHIKMDCPECGSAQ